MMNPQATTKGPRAPSAHDEMCEPMQRSTAIAPRLAWLRSQLRKASFNLEGVRGVLAPSVMSHGAEGSPGCQESVTEILNDIESLANEITEQSSSITDIIGRVE